MNSPSNAMPEAFGSQLDPPAALSPTQPFYWSMRRELWEYRSIYLAPLAIAGVILLGSAFTLVPLAHTMRTAMALDPSQQRQALARPFDVAAGLIMGAAFIVSIFYSLDALYGERRDRSILFWKSLPVSDLTTVLAKASIPVLILPLVTFAVTVVTQWIMALLSTVVLLGSGLSAATLWNHLPLFQMWLGLFDHLVGFHGLWYAPFYCWMLLVSAWARRAPFLWAALPPLAIGVVEKIAFNTSYFEAILRYRFAGSPDADPMDPLTHLSPVPFLISPGLWIGLVVSAAFLAVAIRLRRYHGPM